jgi:hypothetical protein
MTPGCLAVPLKCQIEEARGMWEQIISNTLLFVDDIKGFTIDWLVLHVPQIQDKRISTKVTKKLKLMQKSKFCYDADIAFSLLLM